MASTAVHFFRESNDVTRQVHQAMRDLCYQLAHGDQTFAKHIIAHIQSIHDIEGIDNAWNRLLQSFFEQEDSVQSSFILVLDGCDEAFREDFRALAGLMKPLDSAPFKRQGRPGVKVVMFGRPDMVDIVEEEIERDVPVIEVATSVIEGDIAFYIQNKIQSSRTLKGLPSEIKTQMIGKLTSRAEGMFLWVRSNPTKRSQFLTWLINSMVRSIL